MKYKLVIFDLDGTVLDTLEDLFESVNYSLRIHGLPERSIGEIREFVGNGIRRLVELSVPEGASGSVTDSVFSTFREHYKEHSCDRTKPYDGIIDILNMLKANGILTAVVSNKADFAVKGLVDMYFPGLFSYAAGEKEGVPRKPSPEAVYNAIELLGINTTDTVYIGDSEVDIETALNAGLDSIIVTWGFRDRKKLEAAGAITLADNADELKIKLI